METSAKSDFELMRSNLDTEVNNLTKVIDGFHHAKRFLDLLEQKDCPIFIGYAHPDGRFRYISQPFADALGYTKSEIYDMPWTNLMKKEEADRVFKDYSDAQKNGKSFTNYTTEYIKKDGISLNLTWYTGIQHPDDDKLTLCIAIAKELI